MLVLILLALNYLSVAIFAPGREKSVTIPYNPTFLDQVEGEQRHEDLDPGRGGQRRVQEESQVPVGRQGGGAELQTQIPTFANTDALSKTLQDHNVTIEAKPINEGRGFLLNLILGFGPVILLVALFVWISRRAPAGR